MPWVNRNNESNSSLVGTSTPLINGSTCHCYAIQNRILVENQQQDSDSPVLFVLPVVQSFMQQHGRIGKEIRQNIQSSCSKFILDHVPHKNSPAISELKALAAEDVNIQAILFSSPTTQHSNISHKVIDALIAFSWYRCNNAKPNIEIAKHAVSMAKNFGNKTDIASSLWCLGVTYGFLGKYYVAYDHLQEAYQLYDALLPGNRELQPLCCLCGISMVEAWGVRLTFGGGDKLVSLARDVEKQSATVSDNDIHARNLLMLGKVLHKYGDQQEALRHLEHAKLMGIGSEVYFWIAYVLHHENRLPEALDAAKEAWTLSESHKVNDIDIR